MPKTFFLSRATYFIKQIYKKIWYKTSLKKSLYYNLIFFYFQRLREPMRGLEKNFTQWRRQTDRQTHGHGDSMTESAQWGRLSEIKFMHFIKNILQKHKLVHILVNFLRYHLYGQMFQALCCKFFSPYIVIILYLIDFTII